MNRRLLGALALVLPLAGLGATWGMTHVRAQQGTEWDVPIMGYDPRDLLRGHYVIYTYDWPGLEGTERWQRYGGLCLHGTAPRIERATLGGDGRCANPVRAYEYSDDVDGGLFSGRLYVSQAEGARLQEQLTDPKLQGMVRVRLRDDGHITPLRITFRPRPPEPAATPVAPEEAREP
jgi:hypothetical protein